MTTTEELPPEGPPPEGPPAEGPPAEGPPAEAISPEAISPEAPSSEARELAAQLLAVMREDIGRADTKAAILLSAALALPALLLGRPTTGTAQGELAVVLLAVGGALWAAGAGALVRAILPHTGTVRGRGDMTYFGDLLEAADPLALAARLTEAGRDPLGWLLVQAVDVSTILAAKYRWIRWSVVFLAPGAALAVAGLLSS